MRGFWEDDFGDFDDLDDDRLVHLTVGNPGLDCDPRGGCAEGRKVNLPQSLYSFPPSQGLVIHSTWLLALGLTSASFSNPVFLCFIHLHLDRRCPLCLQRL